MLSCNVVHATQNHGSETDIVGSYYSSISAWFVVYWTLHTMNSARSNELVRYVHEHLSGSGSNQHQAVLCRVSRDVFLWRKPTHKDGVSHCSFALHASATAQISITTGSVDGSDKTFTLVPYEDSESNRSVQDALVRFPHLKGCTAFRFEDSLAPELIAELVQLQLCVSTADDGAVSSVTGIQIAGLLDTEYAAITSICLTCTLHLVLLSSGPHVLSSENINF